MALPKSTYSALRMFDPFRGLFLAIQGHPMQQKGSLRFQALSDAKKYNNSMMIYVCIYMLYDHSYSNYRPTSSSSPPIQRPPDPKIFSPAPGSSPSSLSRWTWTATTLGGVGHRCDPKEVGSEAMATSGCLLGWRPRSLLGWRPWLSGWRLEAIAIRLDVHPTP